MNPLDAQSLSWLDLSQTRVDGIPSLVSDVLPGGYASYSRLLTMLRWPRTRSTWEEMRGRLLPTLSAQLSPEALSESMPTLEGMTWSGPEHRWSEVAALLGLSLSGETTPADLDAALLPEERDAFWEPDTFGWLSEEQSNALSEILRSHTSGDELLVARWEGIGGDWRPTGVAPYEVRPGWRYYLLSLPVAELPGYSGYYGVILWPADRTWVVNSDIRTKSIYVAGSDSLSDDLSAHPALDSFRVGLDDAAW